MAGRFDNRTKEEFIKTIKTASRIEIDIAVRLCYLKFIESGIFPRLVPNGCGFQGEFLETKKVNVAPDYVIGDDIVEITRSNTECKRAFYQKQGKVEYCINNGCHIVFVNAYNPTKECSFLWWNSDQLKHFTDISRQKFGLARSPYSPKPAFRFEISWFNGLWKTLPVIDVALPESYNDILKAVN